MAVTIDEMNISATGGNPAKGATPKQDGKDKPDVRREIEMFTERALRLKAD